MTKICVIAPATDIFSSILGDSIFVQADWCDSLHGETLRIFQMYRHNKFLIVDNQHPISTKEQVGQVGAERLIEVATRLNADEIIIPDVVGDMTSTLRSCADFFQLHPRIDDFFDLMFVPQGDNLDEWKECLQVFLSQTNYAYRVNTIGVPKWLSEQRWVALSAIPRTYQVHFLGCASGWGEFKGDPRIRSWDTSLMYSAAQRGLSLRATDRGTTFPLNGDGYKTLSILIDNVHYVRSLLNKE
jgi:hypothetical protein